MYSSKRNGGQVSKSFCNVCTFKDIRLGVKLFKNVSVFARKAFRINVPNLNPFTIEVLESPDQILSTYEYSLINFFGVKLSVGVAISRGQPTMLNFYSKF